MRETELLEAIQRSPDDDAPRLVYADWLLDRGDPRGELVQLQVALARGSAADPEALRARERELLERHHEAWLGVPFSPHVTWSFDRGFPTGRFGHAGVFVDRTPVEYFACHRYFPDGTAIMVSVSARPDFESFDRLARWFLHGYPSGGPYRVRFAAGASPTLRASCRTEHGVVDYVGTVYGEALQLDTHSHINGHRGELTLALDGLSACDSRAP